MMVLLFPSSFFPILCAFTIVISPVSNPAFFCRKTFTFGWHSSHVSLSTFYFLISPWCSQIGNYFFGACLLILQYAPSFRNFTELIFGLPCHSCYQFLVFVSLPSYLFSYSCKFHFETLSTPTVLSLHLSVAYFPLACL